MISTTVIGSKLESTSPGLIKQFFTIVVEIVSFASLILKEACISIFNYALNANILKHASIFITVVFLLFCMISHNKHSFLQQVQRYIYTIKNSIEDQPESPYKFYGNWLDLVLTFILEFAILFVNFKDKTLILSLHKILFLLCGFLLACQIYAYIFYVENYEYCYVDSMYKIAAIQLDIIIAIISCSAVVVCEIIYTLNNSIFDHINLLREISIVCAILIAVIPNLVLSQRVKSLKLDE